MHEIDICEKIIAYSRESSKKKYNVLMYIYIFTCIEKKSAKDKLYNMCTYSMCNIYIYMFIEIQKNEKKICA